MLDVPDTRKSLLAQVQCLHDEAAWREFVTIYQPVVYRLARRRGLQHADAEDVSQQVLIAVSKSIRDWEPDSSRGRFRSWLARIARHAIINTLTRRPADAAIGGTSILELLKGQPEPGDAVQKDLDREQQRSLFRWAARRIRAEFGDGTWDAFWLTAVEETGMKEAAAVLGKSVGAIYAARSRVIRRLRDEIQQSGFVGGE